MKREFLTTGDGSITLHIPEWNEQYHSKHGAINEALHVFIQAGLQCFLKSSNTENIQIMEIGFGTGLNAHLTQLFSEKEQIHIEYTGVEAFPVLFSEIEKLNYPKLLKSSEAIFEKLHQVPWEIPSQISDYFTLKKRKQFFSEIDEVSAYHLIYFDAFGARVQPELWTEAIFEKMYQAIKTKGVLVTYAAKGSVRRAMEAVGFKVERLPGPPGKREMLRAVR